MSKSILWLFSLTFAIGATIPQNNSFKEISRSTLLIAAISILLLGIMRNRESIEKNNNKRVLISFAWIYLGLFSLIITAQIFMGNLPKTTFTEGIVNYSFFLFLILLSQVRNLSISQTDLVKHGAIICMLVLPSALSALLNKNTFRGSETLSPLANSQDTTFVLAILCIACFWMRKNSQRVDVRLRRLQSAVIFFSIMEILMYRAFGPLLMTTIAFIIGYSNQAKSGFALFRSAIISIALLPTLFIAKRISDLQLAERYGILYKYSNSNDFYGNGRFGAWRESIALVRSGNLQEFLFGFGAGSDLIEREVWGGRSLQSHSSILTHFVEFGLIGFLILISIVLIHLSRLRGFPRMLMISSIVSGIFTAGLIWDRPLPNLILAFLLCANFRQELGNDADFLNQTRSKISRKN